MGEPSSLPSRTGFGAALEALARPSDPRDPTPLARALVAAVPELGAGVELTDGTVRVRPEACEDPEHRALLGLLAAEVTRADALRDGDAVRRRDVHDLRGSLAVLAGQCEMLETGIWGEQTPEQDRAVRAMKRQIDRMREIVDRLRPLSG